RTSSPARLLSAARRLPVAAEIEAKPLEDSRHDKGVVLKVRLEPEPGSQEIGVGLPARKERRHLGKDAKRRRPLSLRDMRFRQVDRAHHKTLPSLPGPEFLLRLAKDRHRLGSLAEREAHAALEPVEPQLRLVRELAVERAEAVKDGERLLRP